MKMNTLFRTAVMTLVAGILGLGLPWSCATAPDPFRLEPASGIIEDMGNASGTREPEWVTQAGSFQYRTPWSEESPDGGIRIVAAAQAVNLQSARLFATKETLPLAFLPVIRKKVDSLIATGKPSIFARFSYNRLADRFRKRLSESPVSGSRLTAEWWMRIALPGTLGIGGKTVYRYFVEGTLSPEDYRSWFSALWTGFEATLLSAERGSPAAAALKEAVFAP